MAIVKELVVRVLESKIFREICCFAALMTLLIAQVLVATQGPQGTRHGLPVNRARLVFANTLSFGQMTVSYRSGNCYKCSLSELGTLNPGENFSYAVDTTFSATLFLNWTGTMSGCNVTQHFREFSAHWFNLSQGDTINCSNVVVDAGDDAYLPILYALITIVGLSVSWVIITQISYRFFLKEGKGVRNAPAVSQTVSDDNSETVPAIQNKDPYEARERESSVLYGSTSDSKAKGRSSPASATLASSLITKGTIDTSMKRTSFPDPSAPSNTNRKRKRLYSLDAFRGLSLTVMIFVNYGGGGYYFFQHSRWNGLTVADLVFPWFVWIMGVSLVFSFHGRRKDSLWRQVYQVFRRMVILFAFGLFFISNNGSSSLYDMRICGVLQRLATTYFVVALTEVLTNQLYKRKSFVFWSPLKDVSNNWVQWIVVVVLETLSLFLTFLIHNEGCPRGYLGPGGISEGGQYRNCTGGAAGVIDYWILKEHHMYNGFTAKHLYQLDGFDGRRFEPEGILGTLNSVVLCYLGVQAGRTLLHFRGRHAAIVIRFFIWGVVLSALATLLSLGQKNEGLIPVNKNLWSLSFILLLAGFAYFLLAVFYLIIDVFTLWKGAPLIYPGMNSILVYMGHELLHGYFPFNTSNEKFMHLTFLSSNLISVSIWLLISYYLYSVNFFFKV